MRRRSISFIIDDTVYKEFKALLALNGDTIHQWLLRAIKEYVRKNK